MMKFFKKNKGQNVAEYAILIALVVGAVIAMQKFAQRGLQARMRDATKYMVDNTSTLGNTAQYEAYYQDSAYDTSKTDAESKAGDGTEERFATNATSIRATGGGSNTYLNASSNIGAGINF